MNFLPVVVRELQVATRRPRTYGIRTLIVCLALGTTLWILSAWSLSTPAQLSKDLFGSLSSLAFVICLFGGSPLMADAISIERREGTLGFLFLTDLRGHDVVLGKLASRSIPALFALFSIFPMLMIPVLMGGITWSEVVRMNLALVGSLLLSLGMGLIVSVFMTDGGKARGLSSLFLIIACTIFPLLNYWAITYWGMANGLRYLEYFSPAYAYSFAPELTYNARPSAYWAALFYSFGLGTLSIIGAGLALGKVWRGRDVRYSKPKAQDRWSFWKKSAPQNRQVLDINPFYWLSTRRTGPKSVWAFLILNISVGLVFIFKFGSDILSPSTILIISTWLHLSLKAWIASDAPRLFYENRRSGSFELILSTPLQPREIVEGQLKGLLHQFGRPILFVLLLDFLLLLGIRSMSFEPDLVIYAFGSMVVFVVEMVAIAYVGMWRGLVGKTPGTATSATFFQIVLLPGILFGFLSIAFMNNLRVWFGFLWPAICVFSACLFAMGAYSNLLERMRLQAIDSYEKEEA